MMRAQSNHGFRLSFQSTDCGKGRSPASLQPVAERAGFIRLKQGRPALAADPLEPQGRELSGQNRARPNQLFGPKVQSIVPLTHT